MDIDYRDYEAIAALEYGTLEDWAFESAEHYVTEHGDLNMVISAMITTAAICKMLNQ